MDTKISMKHSKPLIDLMRSFHTDTNLETYWLSFAGKEGWLGAVIVRASSFNYAVFESNILKVNPGGECLGFVVPESTKIPESFFNRKLTLDDLKEIDVLNDGDGSLLKVKK